MCLSLLFLGAWAEMGWLNFPCFASLLVFFVSLLSCLVALFFSFGSFNKFIYLEKNFKGLSTSLLISTITFFFLSFIPINFRNNSLMKHLWRAYLCLRRLSKATCSMANPVILRHGKSWSPLLRRHCCKWY